MIARFIALSDGAALFLFSVGLGLRFWAFASVGGGGLEFPVQRVRVQVVWVLGHRGSVLFSRIRGVGDWGLGLCLPSPN